MCPPGESVVVPNVVGEQLSEAESLILQACLTVGTVSTANSDTVPADNVISQAPGGGTSVASGSAVNIVVSTGLDETAPTLNITSHNNNQHVSTSSITLSGTASDSGSGNYGIQQVTVNETRASNDTASGSDTANWSLANINLSIGPNEITVVAFDDSINHNTETTTIMLTSDPPDTTGPNIEIESPIRFPAPSPFFILSGSASDPSGIQRVLVNGALANGTTSWSAPRLFVAFVLSPGANVFKVEAFDNSPRHNSTILTTIIFGPPIVAFP